MQIFKRIKKPVCFLLILVNTLSLCSCLGAVSLEKYGYVLTIGLDTGKRYKYSISFLMENEVEESEQKTASKINIITAEGDNIYDAIYIAESGLPYRLNFSRTNYIVISYEIAANDEIMELFSTSWAMLKLRTSANMIVANATASEFIEGLNYSSSVNATKLESNLIDFYENEGLSSMMSITSFMSAIESSRYDAVLPLGGTDTSVDSPPEKDSDTTEGSERKGGMISYTLGAALFSDSVLCGVLSGRENQILLLIQGKLKGSVIQFTRADGTKYSVRIGNAELPRIKVDLSGDKIRLHYSLLVSAVLEQDNSSKVVEKMRKEGKLTEDMDMQIREFLHSACKTVFEQCRDVGCDAAGVGKSVCKEFKTVKEWEEFDFRSRLSDVECDFDIRIELADIYVSTYPE
ncbi:MAG: hypothetical protein IJO93_03350 [Clostridia bacterium]|nr:hypothetical protein [Clostridia bacterium]